MQTVMGIVDLPKAHLGEGSAVSLVALGSVLLLLATQAVALRFWSRKSTGARLLLDDWMVLPAWVAFVIATSLCFDCIGRHALGYPRRDYIPGAPSHMDKATAFSLLYFNVMSIVVFGTAKASALLFYRRVFCAGGQHRPLARVIAVALPVLGVWTVVFVFMTIFQCGTHFDAPWDGTKLKYCTLSYPSIEGVAVSDVLLDVFVVLLPIYPVTKLATTMKNKLAIASVFLVALVAVGASIARLYVVLGMAHIGREVINRDMEYYMSKVTFYWVLEMGVSVLIVNLPPIWTAFDAKAVLLDGLERLDDESN